MHQIFLLFSCRGKRHCSHARQQVLMMSFNVACAKVSSGGVQPECSHVFHVCLLMAVLNGLLVEPRSVTVLPKASARLW